MSRKHIACITVATFVWIISIVYFWIIFPQTDPLLYKIVIQWIVWPICIIVISMHAFALTEKIWIVPLLGVVNMLAELFTFLIDGIFFNRGVDLFCLGACLVYFAAGAFIAFVATEFAKEKKNNG